MLSWNRNQATAGSATMNNISPFILNTTGPADRATDYWRACCCAAGYQADNAARLTAMATLVGATSVTTVPLGLPFPDRAYLLIFPAGVVVLVNGTTDPRQFITSAVGAAVVLNPFGQGSVNSQFLLAALGALAALQPYLQAAAAAQVLYMGHSLGGAVSQLLAQRPQPWPVLGSWTCGQPRVGNSVWANGYTLPSLRYTTSGDPVPLLPPAFSQLVDSTYLPTWPIPLTSYRHVGKRLHVLLDGSILEPQEAPSWIEGTTYLLLTTSGTTDWIGSHATTAYACRVRQGIPVPWQGSNPEWPLIGQLDTIMAPILAASGGRCPQVMFTQEIAPQAPVSRYATEGICQ